MRKILYRTKRAAVMLFCFVILFTTLPNISYAGIFDLISGPDIEDIASAELNGEEPISETENYKFSSSVDELAFNPIYIMNHINKKYVNIGRDLDLSAFLKSVTAAKGVATYNVNKQSDFDVTESNYIAGMDYQFPVYDLTANSDYYVALPNVNMGNNNYPYYDVMVDYNNDMGEDITGCHFEDNILYIPKSALDNPYNKYAFGDKNSIMGVQINYAIGSEGDFTKEIPVQILNENNKPKNKTVLCPNIFDSDRLIVETGVRHKDGIMLFLNGQLIPMGKGAYDYDPYTGDVYIHMMPGVISNINIVFDGKAFDSSGNASEDSSLSAEALSSDASATAKDLETEDSTISSDDTNNSVEEENKDSSSDSQIFDSIKEKLEDIGLSFINTFTKSVYAIAPKNMKQFSNVSGTKTILEISSDAIWVGWRGSYVPPGDQKYIHGQSAATKEKFNSINGWKNSIKYLYGGYTSIDHTGSAFDDSQFDQRMRWTWAITSYAMGVDLSRTTAGEDPNLTIDEKVKHRVGDGSIEKHTIWEWFNDLRTNLEYVNQSTDPSDYNGLGGLTNFAIKFPEAGGDKTIKGSSLSLISAGENRERENTDIPWYSLNTPNVIDGSKEYYFAASCNHLETATGSEDTGTRTVYVTCVGKGDNWVSLAFVLNNSGKQDACGIYKFGMHPEDIPTFEQIDLTTATASTTNHHIAYAGGTVNITDTIECSGLSADAKYKIEGTLLDRNGGVLDSDTTFFTANGETGTYTMSYSMNASGYDNHTVQCIADLYLLPTHIEYDGPEDETGHEVEDPPVLKYSWDDMSDEEEAVHFPKITTIASADCTNHHVMLACSDQACTDTIYYYNVLPGYTYTTKGKCIDKTTGEILQIVESSFYADYEYGKHPVHFNINASYRENHTLAFTEDVYFNGVLVARHDDMSDENQCIHIPKILTTASADSTNHHIMKAVSDQACTDTIHYYNVVPGLTYKTVGTCIDKTSGDTLAVEQRTFTPTEANGDFAVHFNIDARFRKGHTLAFSEEVYFAEVLVGIHDDLSDENQCIHIPKIRTDLTDDESGDKFGMPGKNRHYTDKIYYENVLPGYKYSLDGDLLHKLDMSVETTGNTTFVATSAEGVIDVRFKCDINKTPYTLVAYQDLLFNNVSVADHKEKESETQTVRIARIDTRALDEKTKDHIMLAGPGKIIDTVFYKNMQLGRKFDIKAYVYDQETNKLIGGLTSSRDFITDHSTILGENEFSLSRGANPWIYTHEPDFLSLYRDGYFDVNIPYDFTKLAGRTVVVMEDVTLHNNYAAVHWDINDKSQTVHIPKIETKLEEIGPPGECYLRDTVKYTNLIPYKKYLIVSNLIDNKTGLSVLEVSHTFIPSSADGIENVYFYDKKLAGKTVTAFQDIYYNTDKPDPNLLVGKHEDVNDPDQTVKVIAVGTITIDDKDNFFSKFFDDFFDDFLGDIIPTGDNSRIIILVAIILLAVTGIYFARKKKNK